jgi:hypothetical protein
VKIKAGGISNIFSGGWRNENVEITAGVKAS